MKKVLLIICSALLFSGCSNDDNSLTKVAELKKSELDKSIDGYLFFYYRIAIGPKEFAQMYGYYVGVSAVCPNKKTEHTYEEGDYEGYIMSGEEPKTLNAPVYFWHCTQCKGKFNYYTGKAENDKALGSRLTIYKISIENDSYTIWK